MLTKLDMSYIDNLMEHHMDEPLKYMLKGMLVWDIFDLINGHLQDGAVGNCMDCIYGMTKKDFVC